MLKHPGNYPELKALLYLDPSNLGAGSQNIRDRSPNGVIVSNYGGVVVSDIGPAPGVKSLYFDRTGFKHLRLPWQSFPNLRSGDFTIDFMYCPETQAVGSACAIGQWLQVVGQGGFIATINGGDTAFSFGPDSDYTPVFQLQGGNPTGWTRHTIIREADRFQYRQNGIVVMEKFQPATGPQIQVDLTIGAYFNPQGNIPQGSGVPLNGWLAKVSLWDQAVYF